ncbi:MAG: protein-disulfide isomerase [Candidatus Paceibacteria bacterium]|jgi:protein-disulfide isomerase
MNKIFIPLSIIISALIIAGAVFLTKGTTDTDTIVENESGTPDFSIRSVSEDDHILGNPDADIIIVEYSDYECPFCAKFHPTMEKIIEEYGEEGKVAWVYRHFPLDQIHKRARSSSEASECVAKLGGNSAFWNFSKILFGDQENSLSDAGLKAAALETGVDGDEYQTCVDERQTKDLVNEDFEDGRLISSADPNFGTPYSIAITKDGRQIPIRGAQPYEQVKGIIDELLK